MNGEHACTPACTAGWGPGPRCHCTECGTNFLNVGAFDKHRWHKAGQDGCIDPIAIGLHAMETGVYGEVDGVHRAEKRRAQIRKVGKSRGRG